MKKNISIITLMCGFALLIAGGIILSSCEGPEGPQGVAGVAGSDGSDGSAGPAGADGADGVDGVDGMDGVDANETCIICHNDEVVLLAKAQQTESSHHLEGGNYERNSADCSICHNHQGFTEYLATGAVGTSSIEDPAAINCRTCHMIHTDYTDDDWALVAEAPVVLSHGDATVDLGGESNLCVNCHMSRAISPLPVTGGDSVTITSSRWGPHHGPQGNNLWGVGGYEIAGSLSYPAPGSHTHAGVGCVDCHMAPVPYGGRTAGGHTFNMTYEYHGATEDNIGACTMCHSTMEDTESFDHNGAMTEVEDLLLELEGMLVDKGLMDGPGELWNTPLTVHADVAGAMLNFKTVEEDRSLGVHNPTYIVALLTNSIEALDAL